MVEVGEALLDLDLVLRQRLDAAAQRCVAAGLELVDALGEAVMAEGELADQGVDTGVRRAQRHQLGVGFRQIFLVAVQGRENVLDRAHPRQQRRYFARDLLETVGEIVLAVVGLEVVQRAFELVLAVADLGEDGLDRAALVGDLAHHLAQRLLAAADFRELVVHVAGFVAALLEQSALLSLAQLVLEGGDGLAGVALDQVLDGGVEVVLQGVGDDEVLPGLLEALAHLVEAPVLTRQPPGGCADQRQRHDQDRAGRDALRHRQGREPGGQVADIVTERLLGEKRDGSQQDEPGKQEKQPHREFLTRHTNIATAAIGERNRDQGVRGLPDVSDGTIHGRMRRPIGGGPGWLAGFSRNLGAGAPTRSAVIPGRRVAPHPESIGRQRRRVHGFRVRDFRRAPE